MGNWRHLLGGVTAGHMRDLVPEHGSQLVLVRHQAFLGIVEPGKHHDLPARRGRGIDDVGLEHGHFVGQIWQVRHGGDLFDDGLHLRHPLAVAIEANALLAHGLDGVGHDLPAHLHIVFDQVQVLAPCAR